LIVFWFFFDLDIVICCLWWDVQQFGDRFVVFENGLVVDTCCFLVGAKGTKRIFLAVNIDMCSVSSSIMCKHVVLVLHVAFKIIIENYYFFIFKIIIKNIYIFILIN